MVFCIRNSFLGAWGLRFGVLGFGVVGIRAVLVFLWIGYFIMRGWGLKLPRSSTQRFKVSSLMLQAASCGFAA